MATLWNWKIGLALTLLAASVAGVAVAEGAGGGQGPPSLAQNPTVQACMNRGEDFCNPTPGTRETFVAESWYSKPPNSNASHMTEAEALERARGNYAAAPAFAVLVPYRDVAAADPALAANATVNPDRMVWVVTVHADVRTQGPFGAPGQLRHAYSLVIDAENRGVTDFCVGCEAVRSGQLVVVPTPQGAAPSQAGTAGP
jgi:hypothetical protein